MLGGVRPELGEPTPPARPKRAPWVWRALRWAVAASFLAFAAFVLASVTGVLARVGGTSRDGRMAFPLQLRERTNVLIMGVDVTLNNRRQIVNVARADTLVLATFDPDTRSTSFLSIPRDTRASIPGHRGWWKINAAYAFGGPALTIRTVEQLVGVPVHRYVKLGPHSFARLVDAVGGVWVDVEEDLRYEDWWGGLRIDLKKGRQLLNGEQAMGYARFRHDPLGDIGRTRRQQRVIQALFQRLREPQTWLRAPQILQAVAENTQTDLTAHEVATLGWFLRGLGPGRVRTETLPGEFAPLFWEPDPGRMRPLVLEMFYGLDPAEVAGTTVEVLNASGFPGMARQAADRIAQLGFRVVRVDTAPGVRPQTAVLSVRADPKVVRAVRDLLGVGAVSTRGREEGPADLVVLVGRDFARRAALGEVAVP
jgi:LCP family protein required for cell wall assembly